MTQAARPRRIRIADEQPTSLHQVEVRRRQLLSLVLVMMVLVAAAVVLFSIATDDALGLLDLNVLRSSFVALALVFALYVWSREGDLRRVERALIDSQLRAAGLTSRMRELSALSRAAREASAVLSLDHVLRAILDSARELMGAVRGAVMLFDDAGERLEVAEVLGDDRDAIGSVIPFDEDAWPWPPGERRPIVDRDRAPLIAPPRAGGGPVPVRPTLTIPLVREDDAVGVLSLVVDESDRKVSEQDLDAFEVFAEHAAAAIANARAFEKERRLRERLAEIDAQRREFIATLSHDLKAPLTSILGYANLLNRPDGIDGEKGRNFAGTIERQGRRILGMVERLVVATRLEESKPTLRRERLDLDRIVTEQAEALRGMLGDRHVDLQIQKDLPAVWGDRGSVEQCLVNLLDNAVKFSPDDSTILIEVRVTDGEVVVGVVDEGDGIPESELPTIFERYRRASGEGGMASVGLGLFIVYSLARAQGGRAWAENEPGKGARVTFTLPYRREDR